MKLLIIGHSVVDKIVENHSTSIKPGGIYYSVVSILSQTQSNDKIFLCTSVDKESEQLFNETYDRVEKEYISVVDSIPKVELVVDEIGERSETYSQIIENLDLPTEDLNRFDGILINMISGYDINLDQLEQVRKNYIGLIYFDVHTFSRGVDEQFNRVFRKIKDFGKWALCIDILQTNEAELLTLLDKKDELEIVKELIATGIKQVIITKAERGATVYFNQGDCIHKYHQDAVRVNSLNKVGCGDVFGAVYFYNYIKNKDVILALEEANLFAGISTTYSDINEFLNLRKDADKRTGKK